MGLNVAAAQSSEANCVALLACSAVCYYTDIQHSAETET